MIHNHLIMDHILTSSFYAPNVSHMNIDTILQNLDIVTLEKEWSALKELIAGGKFEKAITGLKHLNEVLRVPRGQIGYKFVIGATLTEEEWKIVDLKRDLDFHLGICYFYLNDFVSSAFYYVPFSTGHVHNFIAWIQSYTRIFSSRSTRRTSILYKRTRTMGQYVLSG